MLHSYFYVVFVQQDFNPISQISQVKVGRNRDRVWVKKKNQPLYHTQEWGKLERSEGRWVQEGAAALVLVGKLWEDGCVKKTACLQDEKQWGEVKLSPFKPCYWFELFIHSTSTFESSKGPCQSSRESGVQKAVTIRKGCGNEINLGSFVRSALCWLLCLISKIHL